MKRRSRLQLACILVALVLVVLVPVQGFALIHSKPNKEISSYDKNDPMSLRDSNLHAQSAILIDQDTGRVLYEKDADQKLYPASMTKLMTALVTIEHFGEENLEQTIVVTNKINTVEPSYVPLTAGETIRVIDVLYGLLLRSGNDAGVALAYAVSGGISGFADLMNQKAAELGCDSTHFANPHGLTDKDHYTTARDFTRIARAAAANPVIARIVSTVKYTIPATDKVDKERTIYSKIKLLPGFAEDDTYHYEGCTGMKTGYTDAAQNTFTGTAERNGQRLMVVLLGTTTNGKWQDSIKLFNYGFASYTPLDILSLMKQQTYSMPVRGSAVGENATVLLRIQDEETPCSISVPTEQAEQVLADPSACLQVIYTKQNAPIQVGDVVGSVTFTLDNTTVTRNLVATRNMEMAEGYVPVDEGAFTTQIPTLADIEMNAKNSPYAKLLWLLLVPIVLLIFFAIWFLVEVIRRKKRLRARRMRQRNELRMRAQGDLQPQNRNRTEQSFEWNETYRRRSSGR